VLELERKRVRLRLSPNLHICTQNKDANGFVYSRVQRQHVCAVLSVIDELKYQSQKSSRLCSWLWVILGIVLETLLLSVKKEKWLNEENKKPKKERRPLPQPPKEMPIIGGPASPKEIDAFNEA
jgi:hypothetical protein